jgi:two-component system invasion response regulator UvrY
MTDPASPGKALPHLAGISVLIVDDSAAVRQRVAESLASIPGVEVAGEAADVPAGRRLLDEIKPGVLVLDIDLPTQSGMELLKLAKRQPDAPVVIMLSIHHEAPFRQKCAELGADFFFHKLSEFD